MPLEKGVESKQADAARSVPPGHLLSFISTRLWHWRSLAFTTALSKDDAPEVAACTRLCSPFAATNCVSSAQ